jgi:hypothetical protein
LSIQVLQCKLDGTHTLVKHGVESDGSLSGLTVTNDQLTLTTANGHHGVDGLQTSLYGLVDGTTGQDTGGLELSTALLGSLDGTLSIDGVAEGVDNTSEKSLTDGNVDLLLLALVIPRVPQCHIQSLRYA